MGNLVEPMHAAVLSATLTEGLRINPDLTEIWRETV